MSEMERVTKLLREADDLMDQAETQIELDFEKGRRLYRKAVSNLEEAYLYARAEESPPPDHLSGDVAGLFTECLNLEPDFETIRAEIDLLSGNDGPVVVDAEIICDAANEIWDFMYELMEAMD